VARRGLPPQEADLLRAGAAAKVLPLKPPGNASNSQISKMKNVLTFSKIIYCCFCFFAFLFFVHFLPEIKILKLF
jgi:hypothetical protein